MTNVNYYGGVTAYMKNNTGTNHRIRLLAEAIFQLQPFIGLHDEDFRKDAPLMASDVFQYMKDNHTMFTNPASSFPANTPAEYQEIDLTTHEIKDEHMIRLHIPVIHTDPDEIHYMIQTVIPVVLDLLFSDNLLTIKMRTSTDEHSFADAKETILVSAERHNVAV